MNRQLLNVKKFLEEKGLHPSPLLPDYIEINDGIFLVGALYRLPSGKWIAALWNDRRQLWTSTYKNREITSCRLTDLPLGGVRTFRSPLTAARSIIL